MNRQPAIRFSPGLRQPSKQFHIFTPNAAHPSVLHDRCNHLVIMMAPKKSIRAEKRRNNTWQPYSLPVWDARALRSRGLGRNRVFWVQLMRRESGEGASEMAVAVAVAAKDAEIAGLQRELLDLELQAQEEIGEMHEELLEMRRSHQAVELALKDSEQKRCPPLSRPYSCQ